MPVEAPSPDDLTTQAYVEAALLRPLTDQEVTYLPTLIEAATGKLLNRMPSLPDRIVGWSAVPRTASAVNPVVVADVLAEVIKRRLTNPKGLWSTSDTRGPFSRSETYSGSRAGAGADSSPGRLEVTDADVAQINASAEPAGGVIAGTIRTRAGLFPDLDRSC